MHTASILGTFVVEDSLRRAVRLLEHCPFFVENQFPCYLHHQPFWTFFASHLLLIFTVCFALIRMDIPVHTYVSDSNVIISSECQKPFALVILSKNELMFHDLLTPTWVFWVIHVYIRDRFWWDLCAIGTWQTSSEVYTYLNFNLVLFVSKCNFLYLFPSSKEAKCELSRSVCSSIAIIMSN